MYRMNRPLYLAQVGHLAGQAALPQVSPSAEGGIPAVLDDNRAVGVINIWRQLFPDAAPLPGIGMPSQNKGVLTLTHTMAMPGMPKPSPMLINGLPSKSPLANNALSSHEVSNGRWLNLYEIMLPETPGSNGAPSTVQRYVDALSAQNVDVAGNHYHWSGGTMMGRFPIAVHSQSSTLDPATFAQAHVNAIKRALGIQ